MQTIDAKKLRDRLQGDSRPTVVNVLPEKEYRAKHIPGSINAPYLSDDFAQAVSRAADGKSGEVVVYCASTTCDASPKAARKLEEAGFLNVVDFAGGMAEWQDAGLPVESGGGSSH